MRLYAADYLEQLIKLTRQDSLLYAAVSDKNSVHGELVKILIFIGSDFVTVFGWDVCFPVTYFATQGLLARKLYFIR